ncbi:uncharacterized protein LOC128286842 [Gossypium arboreum]|uniref:uncharacterized protein LOC128286842 n=1 Tax=Gossypium arboreum TaxID=29729 RepID=UPI0022F194B6|nr:uncharacterized protein LOC128286842 [Gossypium arboreum]
MDDIDFHHPLFLHPSDTLGTVLVSHRLTDVENYTVWSRSLRIALLAKNKLEFIDGVCLRSVYPESLRAQWDRCNTFVLSWIFNTVSPDLLAGLVFASDAAAVWKDLKDHFSKVDGSRIFFLHQSIAHLTQVDASVSSYFTQLKLLWDEYTTLVSFFDCAFRSQILLMQPLPSVNRAYYMIVQEEAKRSFSSFTGTCDFCKLKDHKKESYYQLIGFLPDFKFNHKKAPPSALAVSSDGSSLPPQSAPTFTPQQYSQILELLNKSQVPVAPAVNCDLSNGRMKEIGRHSNGLYLFESSSSLVRSFGSPLSLSTSFLPASTSCMTSIVPKILLWHARLGHMPMHKLHRLPFFNTLTLNKRFTCSICPMARLSKLSFPISTSRAETSFSLIHLDVWGPYRMPTHSGHHFFLTIVDDHTRMT